MKTCSTCGQTKPFDAYHANRARPDGVQTYCKDCKRQKDRAYYYRRYEKSETATIRNPDGGAGR